MGISKLLLWIAVFIFWFSLPTTPVRGDSSPALAIDFNNGIGFNHPEKLFDVTLRFRSQNLLQYESSLPEQDARVTGQPRRLRLRLGGWLWSEKLRFNLQLAFTRGDMDWENTQFPNIVRDAMVTYQALPSLEIAFGQGKLPGNRQRVISSGELQLVDRSIVNRAFNLDRDFGFQARLYSRTQTQVDWTLIAAITTGGGRNATARDANSFALTTRAEILPMGQFKMNGDYFEGDLLTEETPKLSLGLFASRFHGITRSGGTVGIPLQEGPVGRGFFTWGGDIFLKYLGASVACEYLKKSLIGWTPMAADFEGTLRRFSPPLDGDGLSIQTGYLLGKNWEATARYSVVTPETTDLEAFSQQQKQITLGISRYIHLHRLKVQSDLSRSFFSTTQSGSPDTTQWMARFQVELGI